MRVCVMGRTLPWHAGALQPPAPTYSTGVADRVDVLSARFCPLAGGKLAIESISTTPARQRKTRALVMFAIVEDRAAYTPRPRAKSTLAWSRSLKGCQTITIGAAVIMDTPSLVCYILAKPPGRISAMVLAGRHMETGN